MPWPRPLGSEHAKLRPKKTAWPGQLTLKSGVMIPSSSAAAADPAGGEVLGRLVHQMKGAAGGYGFPQISEAAARLEQALEQEGSADAATGLEALVALCERVRP